MALASMAYRIGVNQRGGGGKISADGRQDVAS